MASAAKMLKLLAVANRRSPQSFYYLKLNCSLFYNCADSRILAS
ncbi:hypothetical protein [Calothrix sp. NIES-2098]